MFEVVGKRVWAIALRLAIGAATGVAGLAGLNVLWPAATPPMPEIRVDAGRSTRLLLAIDLAVLAAKDYVKAQDPTVGHEFDQGLRRVQDLVARLEREDEPGQAAARTVQTELLRIEAIVRGVRGSAGADRVTEIAESRDRIAGTMTLLHTADARQVEGTADDASAVAFKVGGAGLATLGLCFAGGVGLARLCVV
jgi:hypothetical protein